MKTEFWTLVQHSGHFKPAFSRAVEEAAVTREGMVEKIREAGGLLFTDYLSASEAADKENYPAWVKGLIPHCEGHFVNIVISGRKLYIPGSQPHTVGTEHPNSTNDPIGRFRDARFSNKGDKK